MPQDMPPTGGYEPVQYKRNLPARGFRPATYLIMVGAICTYGFWRSIEQPGPRREEELEERARDGEYRIAAIPGRERLQEAQMKIYRINWPNLDFEKEVNADFVLHSELAREKMWSRIHLIPMLQAEEDRDQVRRHLADKARERELLGAETKVYHSDRFVRPTFAVTPNEVTK
ncbi:hypothetical protein D6D19_09833 [Aureobasidium pullulans]|uniref:NADH dehydrogenase [ubiquinone] 1 alpha subcomplex subunit 13 n=1 Tax=Aureobasidium pullulans TaxID=5580 RepID=A0A4S9K9W5_AURPU|nr:hypothetical protein D6D19_09833 [Aureobasidium pullulans]THY11944.1 hypothetical protein D6D00_10543 [Aureobasidium pullulans]